MKTTTIAIISAVILVVIGGAYFLNRGGSVSNPINQTITNPSTSQTQGIQSDSDLTATSTDLDNTDVDSVDGDLNQNQTDASSF